MPDSLVMPVILVLDLLSVLVIGDDVSNGISWIPLDCFGQQDSLSGESLSYVMHKRRQILGQCHPVNPIALQ